MATNGGYSRRQARRLRREFLERHWWRLALAAVVMVGAFLAFGLIESFFQRWFDRGLIVAFFLGVGVTAAVAMIVALLNLDGGRTYREGDLGESWTAHELKRLRKQGWTVFHDIEFDGWNVDHLLVGRRGVIAVETKLRNEEWTITSHLIEDGRGRPLREAAGIARQAQRQARTLRSMLSVGGVDTTVTPIVVLWGARIAGEPTVAIDGVLVGRGACFDEWFDEVQTSPLSPKEVERAERVLEDYLAGEGVKPLPPVRGAARVVERESPTSLIGRAASDGRRDLSPAPEH